MSCIEAGKGKDTRPSAHQRGYGADWRAIRPRILARDPICRLRTHCAGAASKHVDHVTAREAGGTDDDGNLMGTCHSCHSAKTATQDGGFGNRKLVSA